MSRDHGFEKRMRRRLEQAGCYVLKMPDAPAPFIGRPDLEESAARFTVKNPFDFVVLWAGWDDAAAVERYKAYAFEMKSTASPRFVLSTVKPHQVKGLSEFPGVARVLVEIRQAARCFAVPLSVWTYWEAESGKLSMNLGDLEGHCMVTELPRNTIGRERLNYYDVGPLLECGV